MLGVRGSQSEVGVRWGLRIRLVSSSSKEVGVFGRPPEHEVGDVDLLYDNAQRPTGEDPGW
jgi:hypothetical protein